MTLPRLKRELKKTLPTLTSRKKKQHLIRWGVLTLVLGAAVFAGWRYYQMTAPERLFRQGLTAESEGAPERALSFYQSIQSRYGDSDRAPRALLRAGRLSRYDLRQDQQALLYFLRLEKQYPQSYLVEQAQRQAADLTKNRLREFSQAIVVYQRLLEREPEDADRIQYEIADCYFRLGNYAQARIEYETLLERFSGSVLRAEVLFRIGRAMLLERDYAGAREHFLVVSEEFPESPYAQEALFSLAGLFEVEERLPEALTAYRALKDYPHKDVLQRKIERLIQRMVKKERKSQ